MKRGIPDRVPVYLAASLMKPCQLTGKPYWDVEFRRDPPLWKAQMDFARKFDEETFITAPGLEGFADAPGKTKEIVDETDDHLVIRETCHTRRGNMTALREYLREKSSRPLEAYVKDPLADKEKIRCLLVDPRTGTKSPEYDEVVRSVGDDGVIKVGIVQPVTWWLKLRLPLQAGILDFFEHPDLMEGLLNEYEDHAVAEADAICRVLKPEVLSIGGSTSSISVISPRLYRRYNLRFMSRVTEICRRHGVLSYLHMCGKSREVLEMLADDTELDFIEPLERPPGGNVDLAEVKEKFGSRFCLGGNVNTFETLARGTPAEVEAEARECIEAAAEDGGFILVSGDQPGSDTPDENLRAMVAAARTYGIYPLAPAGGKSGSRRL